MSSRLSEQQRPAKGSVPEYDEAIAAEQDPGEPRRWLLPKQKVGSLSNCAVNVYFYRGSFIHVA